MKLKTTNQFIIDAKNKHGDLYDYSLTEYLNSHIKIKIICKKHGVFDQLPIDHLKKHGCPICSGNKKGNSKDFINKCKIIYKNENYNYSLVDYKDNKSKVKIICKEHGIFKIRPDMFLQKKIKCPFCNTKINNIDKFIEKSNSIHNNLYDYSLVDYINTDTNVKIICKGHGAFEQTPHNHMNGTKCPKCSTNQKISTIDFIKKSNKVHDNLYDYSLSEYVNTYFKVKIICKKHGIFEQSPSSHLCGCGCPICRESKGEKSIRLFLTNNNIKFVHQKRFNDCKNNNPLPFDFYLSENNTCIEFDGEQHFKQKDFFGGKDALNITKTNDMIKTKYCKYNKIKLIRIPYYSINNIDKILFEKIVE